MSHHGTSSSVEPAVIVFWLCYGTVSLVIAYCAMKIAAVMEETSEKRKRASKKQEQMFPPTVNPAPAEPGPDRPVSRIPRLHL